MGTNCLNTDVCMFKSSQSRESSAQPDASSKACRKPQPFVCSLSFLGPFTLRSSFSDPTDNETTCKSMEIPQLFNGSSTVAWTSINIFITTTIILEIRLDILRSVPRQVLPRNAWIMKQVLTGLFIWFSIGLQTMRNLRWGQKISLEESKRMSLLQNVV